MAEPAETNELVPCLFCDLSLVFPNGKAEYLGHLFVCHRFVIADVQDIRYLEEYLKYWKAKFDTKPIEEYCSTMLMDQRPDGTPSKDEKYFLLSDCVAEDREIREKLDRKYLASVLERHQFEKNDETFEKGCLYCRDVIRPSRAAFIKHVYDKHFLQIGKPENLVFIDELIVVVEQKMNDLVCLYCEKVFRDRATLKEHMRKKGHKRIPENNKFYDKFFLTNYYKPKVEPKSDTPKPRKKVVRERKDSSRVFETDNDDSAWSDWESTDQSNIKCLFCDSTCGRFDEIKKHMIDLHRFEFDKATRTLNYYQRIKLVNYIRHQISQTKCPNCCLQHKEAKELMTHMDTQNHFDIRDEKLFNQPQFFFSTIEDDAFLCCVEDTSEDDRPPEDDSAIVICEDANVKLNEAAEKFVNETLLKDL